MLMPAISRYMTRQPWTIHRDATLAAAKELMREHDIRHLPVLDGDAMVGIVSERDVYRLERLGYLDRHFTVGDAMNDEVQTADAEDPVDRVVETMSERKHGSTVVVSRHGKVAGIFTSVDAMRVLAEVLQRIAT